MKKAILSAVVACCALAANVMAEESKEQKQQLDDIVVTATRTERKTDEVAAGISVVSKENIQNTRLLAISSG
jgi:outer membrane cobalamin receptor